MINLCFSCLSPDSIDTLEIIPTVNNGSFCLDSIMRQFPSAHETLSYLHTLKQTASTALKEKITEILEINTIIVKTFCQSESSLKSIKCAYLFALMRREDVFFSKHTICWLAELRLYLSRLEIHLFLSVLFCGEYAQRLPVLLRYNQLSDISSEYITSNIDVVTIALFIEKKLKRLEEVANAHFKKGTYAIPRIVDIPYSIDYVGSDQTTYILLKSPLFESEEKCTLALSVPNDSQKSITTVMRYVSATDIDRSKIVRVHESLSGEKGIWPVLGSLTYTKPLCDSNMMRKAAWFTPVPEHTLLQVITGDEPIRIDFMVEVIDQLAHGLVALHSAGYIHGSIDAETTFFSINSGRQVVAGFSNFKSLFLADRDQSLHAPFDQGFYGSLLSTAPELFACEAFDGDLCKLDIWAFGALLFPIFFGHAPAWHSFIKMVCENTIEIDEAVRCMNDQVFLTIEERRIGLLDRSERSLEEEYQLLICDMMRLDPSLRIDAKETLERVSQINSVILGANKL